LKCGNGTGGGHCESILKIAGGVFLGILAAFAVYKVVEIWLSQAAEKRVEEDIRLAAKAERLRLTKAVENLPILQPDKLEALCGVSLRVRRDAKGGHVELNISHMGADGHVVEMNSHCLVVQLPRNASDRRDT
jgi:hypothetical protein